MDRLAEDPREILSKLQQHCPEQLGPNGLPDLQLLAALLGTPPYGLQWVGKEEAYDMATHPSLMHLALQNESCPPDQALHILVEGDNLDALKLMQHAYTGKIKLIYIDPPYNTGSDGFVYTDRFSEHPTSYRQRTGIHQQHNYQQFQDAWKKNTLENGRFHAQWLSMLLPRIVLGRNLLKDDGLMMISIDDREVDHLKLLCNEVFGEENYLGKLIWLNRTTPNDAKKGLAIDHEYILLFAKDATKVTFKGVEKDLSHYKNPDKDPQGPWVADNPSAASGNEAYRFPIVNPYTQEVYTPPKGRYWAFAPRRVAEWTASGKLVFPKEQGKNFLLKKYHSELRSHRKPLSSVIHGILTAQGTKELKALFQGASPFRYPKPTALMKLLIGQVTGPEDIILDFFAGSGTTCHAAMALNQEEQTSRQCISVQLDEPYVSPDQELARTYPTVAAVTKARIRKVVAQMGLTGANGNLAVFKLEQPKPATANRLYHYLLLAGFPFHQPLKPFHWPGVVAFQPEPETLLVTQVHHSESFVQLIEKVQVKLVICPKDAFATAIPSPELPHTSIQWLS